MTPTVQKSAPTKCQAPDTPHDSGHLPDMCQPHKGVEAMFALSEAITNSFSVESGPVVLPLSDQLKFVTKYESCTPRTISHSVGYAVV